MATKFKDIGKPAEDLLFKKGWGTGSVSVSAKTSAGATTFEASGSHNNKKGEISGGLKVEYKNKARGIKVNEEWNTKNKLTGKVTFSKLADNVEASVGVAIEGGGKKQSANATLGYTADAFRVNLAASGSKDDGATVGGDAVVSYEGGSLGVSTSYGVKAQALKGHHIKLGYKRAEYNAAVYIKDEIDRDNKGAHKQTYGVNYHHKVRDDLQVAGSLTWDRVKKPVATFGAARRLDGATVSKIRADSEGRVGLALVSELAAGLSVNASTVIDARNLSSGSATQFGLGVTFESK